MRTLLVVVFLVALTGCAPVPVVPKANPVVTVRCVYPVIAALPETKELQQKGGINISLAPNSFICADAVRTTSREIPRTPFDFEETYSLVSYINSGAGGRPENYKLIET